jgi:hypothetical protein
MLGEGCSLRAVARELGVHSTAVIGALAAT